jgi:hypothetical protein
MPEPSAEGIFDPHIGSPAFISCFVLDDGLISHANIMHVPASCGGLAAQHAIVQRGLPVAELRGTAFERTAINKDRMSTGRRID